MNRYSSTTSALQLEEITSKGTRASYAFIWWHEGFAKNLLASYFKSINSLKSNERELVLWHSTNDQMKSESFHALWIDCSFSLIQKWRATKNNPQTEFDLKILPSRQNSICRSLCLLDNPFGRILKIDA